MAKQTVGDSSRDSIGRFSRTTDASVRFWPKVDKDSHPGGCWVWCGSRDRSGYGQILITGSTKVKAHRFSYAMSKGAIPSGFDVCHTCDNPSCVNPEHLWAGTRSENMRDMVNKGRAICTLKPNQVASLRAERGLGISARVLASTYGITETQVYRILDGTRWHTPTTGGQGEGGKHE